MLKTKKQELKKKILAVLGLGLILTLSLLTLSIRTIDQLENANGWVQHTYQVINITDKLDNAFSALILNVRQSIIAPEAFQEETYIKNKEELLNEFLALKAITSDNTNRQQELAVFYQDIKQKLEITDRALSQNPGDINAAIDILNAGKNLALDLKIKAKIKHTKLDEERLLSLRNNHEQIIKNRVKLLLIFGGLFAVISVLISIFVIFKDTGKLTQIEEQLVEDEYKLKQFLDSIPLGITVLNTNKQITYINPEASALFKNELKLQTVDVEKLSDIVFIAGTNHKYPTETGPFSQAMRGRLSYAEDIEFRNEDITLNIAVTAKPIFKPDTDVVQYVLVIYQNITKQRQIDEQLRMAKASAEKNAAFKEEFLANMSHEIRNPLNAVLGYNSLLRKSALSKEQAEFANAIQMAGNNLLSIINDILDYSKMQAGMMKLESVPINIESILQSVETMLALKAKEKSLNLEVQIDPNVHPLVLGDPVRLTQIVVNLVSNAIKFTAKGKITISLSAKQNQAEQADYIFEIKDTGIGIPKEKLKTIFERYSQASASDTRQYGGTGLGLSICKEFVELHGGKMTVESEEGKGSTFRFNIPYTLYFDALNARIAENEDVNLSGIHILLAEDNEINRALISKTMAVAGIKLDETENGKQAIAALQNKKYDLVLMDIMMPEMDGMQATKYIREVLKLKVPILAMTGHAMSGEREKCLIAGMNDYIAKPFRSEDIFKKINQLVQQHKEEEVQMENSNTEEAPIFDISYLQELSGNHTEFIIEMIDLFMHQVPAEIEELGVAVNEQRWDDVVFKSHKLKSSTGTLGAKALFELMKNVEQAGKDPLQQPEISAQMILANELLSKTIAELQQTKAALSA